MIPVFDLEISAVPKVRRLRFPPSAQFLMAHAIGNQRAVGGEQIQVDRKALDMQTMDRSQAVLSVPYGLLGRAPGLAQRHEVT